MDLRNSVYIYNLNIFMSTRQQHTMNIHVSYMRTIISSLGTENCKAKSCIYYSLVKPRAQRRYLDAFGLSQNLEIHLVKPRFKLLIFTVKIGVVCSGVPALQAVTNYIHVTYIIILLYYLIVLQIVHGEQRIQRLQEKLRETRQASVGATPEGMSISTRILSYDSLTLMRASSCRNSLICLDGVLDCDKHAC